MSESAEPRFLLLSAVHGAAAWCAYAVTEFVFSSVLYGVARPYAIFTPWHWRLTAILIVAYAVAGLVAGSLAGAGLRWLRRAGILPNDGDRAALFENAGTFTLVLAFAANLLLLRAAASGRPAMLGAAALFMVLLVLSMRSARWRERLGLLTNPWIVSGLLLGLGQGFALAEMHAAAEQFGAKYWLWVGLLTGVLVLVAIASIWPGRRLRAILERGAVPGPQWAALVLALGVLGISGALARRHEVRAEAAAAPGQPGGRPNVLVIVLDTVRADHLALYGYPRKTTPNLDALARDSAVYTHAIAPSDMTLTSHASLFTGVYGSWHGAYCRPPHSAYGSPISSRYRTLAEILGANGYSTYGVSANVYLRADFGVQRGFSEFRIPRPVPVLPAEYWYLLRGGMRRALSSVVDTAQFDRLFARGEDVNRTLFDLLNADPPGGRPFFVFLNYMDSHFPYVPPAPFDRLFPGKERRLTQDDMERDSSEVIHGRPLPPGDASHRVSQYDGGIAYDDARIGEVLNWLKQRNVYDNTLIVLATDHGEAFGEKNLVLHGNSAYQTLLHVGLVLKYPHGARRGVYAQPVSLIDVLPTAMDALGLPPQPGVQGIDLVRDSSAPRTLFSESFPCPVIHSLECPDGCTARAVIAWPKKYIASSSGRRELYDLATDPNERRNELALNAKDGDSLRQSLSAWLKTAPSHAERNTTIDSESIRRLRSLGYVQ